MSYVDKVKDRNGEVADIHDTGARDAIAALQEAVGGLATFDQYLDITIGGNTTIPANTIKKIPCVVRLNNAILCVREQGPAQWHAFVGSRSQFGIWTGSGAITSDVVLSEYSAPVFSYSIQANSSDVVHLSQYPGGSYLINYMGAKLGLMFVYQTGSVQYTAFGMYKDKLFKAVLNSIPEAGVDLDISQNYIEFGTKLYKHSVIIGEYTPGPGTLVSNKLLTCVIYSTVSTPATTLTELGQVINARVAYEVTRFNDGTHDISSGAYHNLVGNGYWRAFTVNSYTLDNICYDNNGLAIVSADIDSGFDSDYNSKITDTVTSL